MAILVETRTPWIIKSLPCEPAAPQAGWLQDLIAAPPRAVASELNSRDFVFLTTDAIKDRAETVRVAQQLIDQVPSMSSAVRAIVQQIFLFGAREEYDVNHSEPRWPNWIFVSAPRPPTVLSGVRLAENVVHEAMHLQLTQLEARVPLVADTVSKLESPWKPDPRHLQGLLHGLYVFACISAFFRRLLDEKVLPAEVSEHTKRRLHEIAEEIATLPMARLIEGLTNRGKQFVEAIQGTTNRVPN